MARWWRPVLLVTLVIAGSAVLLVTGWPTVEGVRATTAAAGWAAPVLFTLLFVGFTLVPAPATVMGIAAGVLFGLPVGLATTMTAVAAGSLIGFVLSRALGREVVAGGRLLPVIPFPVLSYACGLTAIRLRDYLAGSVLGVLPSAVAFVTIGAYGGDPGSVPFLVAVAGLVVLTVAALVASRTRRRAGRTARRTAGRTAEAPVPSGPVA